MKKLKMRFKAAIKAFRNPLVVRGSQGLEVSILDNSDFLGKELIISDEREDEIQKLVFDHLKSCDTMTEAMTRMSKQAVHPNELMYMGVLTGTHHARATAMKAEADAKAAIMRMITQIGKDKE